MKWLYLVLGLMAVSHSASAATSGAISAKLVITSRCNITGMPSPSVKPTIDCGKVRQHQPRVTQSPLVSDGHSSQQTQLVTVEW